MSVIMCSCFLPVDLDALFSCHHGDKITLECDSVMKMCLYCSSPLGRVGWEDWYISDKCMIHAVAVVTHCQAVQVRDRAINPHL